MAFTLNDFNAFPIGMQIRGYTGNSEMAFTLNDFNAFPTGMRIRRHGKFGKQRFIQHKEIEMRRELTSLREQMRKHNIDWYLIPSSDPHGSEYLNPHFRCREYISGFTGSAGTLLVGMDEAYLWTMSRLIIWLCSWRRWRRRCDRRVGRRFRRCWWRWTGWHHSAEPWHDWMVKGITK